MDRRERINQLKEERANLYDRARDIDDGAAAAHRDYSADDRRELDEIQGSISDLSLAVAQLL